LTAESANEPALVASTKLLLKPPRLRRKWLGESDLTLISLVLVIKVLLFVFGATVVQVYQNRILSNTRARLEIWNQWDSLHYVGIAATGYQATGEWYFRLVFYPLYPWLARLFAPLAQGYLPGAILVSTIASLALAVLFNRLLRLDENARVARQAALFLFIFPTSYFLHIAYTESLFIALMLGAFYAARTRRWVTASVVGALAAFTRVNGLLLGPALLVEAWLEYRETGRWNWRWCALPFIGAGLLAYLYLNHRVTGVMFRFAEIQRDKWEKSLTFPWRGIKRLLSDLSWRPPWEKHMVVAEELIFIALGFLVVFWCWRRMRASYSVWVTLNMLLFISTTFIQSTPRYTLILFPMFIMFARAAARPLWQTVISVWSLMFLAFFVSLFVQGKWAF
jgi:hypothetical protein